LLGALLLCWAPAAVARAYEDQLTLGLGAGYAYAASSSQPQNGALFDLSSSVGLSAVLTVRARLSYAFHPAARPLHAGLAGAELLYMVDVVELVPYFGAGLDAVGRAREPASLEVDGAVHLVAGLDYLLSRTLALGIDLRPLFLLTALHRDPLYVAVTASVTWLFDR
jgi:hypothetical protein